MQEREQKDIDKEQQEDSYSRNADYRPESLKREDERPRREVQTVIENNHSVEKQKIIEQNIKLKEQIFDLSQQLQEILEKDKNRKKRMGPINANDDDQTLREKKGELRKQQLQIMEMKNKIYTVKRQLEKVYNNRNMINKEQQLRALKQELRQLDEEKEGLDRIKKEQAKHLKNLINQEQYQQKIEDLKKQLTKVKEEARTVNEKVVDAERILRKNHEQYITKQQKLRQLQQRLSNGKDRLKTKKPLPTITPEMINSLEQEIGILEQERRQNQRLWQQKIRSIDLEYEQKRLEEEKKLLILKQKQKQYRLNDLKIKELRKLVRHNIGGDSANKSSQVDMSQFRHKRNIKYLDR